MELAPRKKLSCITLVSLYLNKYVHNDLIGDLDLFSIPEAIFSSDQAALWKVLSICLSIHLSVCYTFFTMFLSLYHHEVITSDRSDVMQKVKVRGQRWRSQRSKQILPQFGHFWTLTPFLIHRWLSYDAQQHFLMSQGPKNWRFESNLSKISLGQSQLMIKYPRFYFLTLKL